MALLVFCTAASATPLLLPSYQHLNETLAERQIACGVDGSSTVLDGDGDPHEDYLHKQLSVSTSCHAFVVNTS